MTTNFVMEFNLMAEAVYELSKEKGFWVDGIGWNDKPDDKIPQFSKIEVELADKVIRIMDYAAARELRLGEAIVAKLDYNSGREL